MDAINQTARFIMNPSCLEPGFAATTAHVQSRTCAEIKGAQVRRAIGRIPGFGTARDNGP